MKKILILLLAGVFLFGACGVSQDEHGRLKAKYTGAKKENENLKNLSKKYAQKIESLEKEIKEEKSGAETLLKQANDSYSAKNYDDAWETLNQLLTKHPGSNEVKGAKKLAAKMKPIIKKIQKQRDQKFKEIAKEFRFSESYDEETLTTSYIDRYYTYSGDRVFLQIFKPAEGNPWVGLHLRSFGMKKLSISQFIFKTGNKTHYIVPPKKTVLTESPSKPTTFTEEIVIPVDDNIKTIIDAVIKSDKTTVVFKGNYSREYTVMASEKKGLESMLKAIKELGLKY